MKYLLSLFFTGLFTALHGQPEAKPPLEQAQQLHADGLLSLGQPKAAPFDSLVAYGKFRRSLHLLQTAQLDTGQLSASNKQNIERLTAYFSKLANTDSLLRLSRFYPDSVFLADRRYSERLKSLLTQYLNQRKRSLDMAFFQVEGIHYPFNLPGAANLPFRLDFNKFWPLELRVIEQGFLEIENAYSALPAGKRDQVLHEHYETQLELLKERTKSDSLNQNMQHLRQQKEGLDKEATELQQQYLLHRNIGIGLLVALLLAAYFILKKNAGLLKKTNQNLLEEKKRSEELLLNILPADVARQLKTKGSAKAQRYEQASVMFTDFQNFSKITELLSPEELVRDLDHIFSAFDRIVDKYSLQKIKTIGDAYMCVGGMYTQGSSHVVRMICAGLEMQAFLADMKERRAQRGLHFFEARIGIHTGPIIAGVIGVKKFAFDVWGETVNVAQQMEALCEPGRVNISKETHELANGQFHCEYKGKRTDKHGKSLEMYLVKQAS